jgi:t-SNARE complex subunit (syntaxin)
VENSLNKLDPIFDLLNQLHEEKRERNEMKEIILSELAKTNENISQAIQNTQSNLTKFEKEFILFQRYLF